MPVTDALYHADLEIRILAREGDGYPVEITFSGEREFPRGRLDPGQLPWVAGISPKEDGDRLFSWLFEDQRLRDAWTEARGQSPERRVRLRIDQQAAELHTLPWELLREAVPGEASRYLTAAQETPFSRYMAGTWRSGRPILERPLKLLVAIASPEDLADRGLQPINIDEEKRSLEEALRGGGSRATDRAEVDVTFLEPPVTLAALEEALAQGPHMLHLVAHGSFSSSSDTAVLFLADDENRIVLTKDEEIASMLTRQGDSLRMIFLASCESAARSSTDAFRGLAPRLIAAGVPAVLAMQDTIPVDTARAFAAIFYDRLLHHGQVDLATNEARSAVLTGKLPGACVPVLFQRLKNSLLFARQGQILGKKARGFWITLLDNIKYGECTPLLGPAMCRGLLPSHAELARSLAEKYDYPFPDRDNLPRVAQFVATFDQTSLRRDILRLTSTGFRHGRKKKPKLQGSADRTLVADESADRTLAIDRALRDSEWAEGEEGETEIHHQLAELGLPLYLTTNFDSFMTLALEAQGQKPRREALTWRGISQRDLTDPTFELDPPPSPEEPVVLHLFGNDAVPRSMVLTEDDHLDYLSRFSRDHEYLLPLDVTTAMAQTTLLFLGFDLQDLGLKIILRGLLDHLDAGQWGRLHVAVQIDTRDATDGSDEVKNYLEDYFGQAQINVYWGSTHQFVSELHTRWRERNEK